MSRYGMLLARWGVWALVVSLESVVGFPWASLFLAGEWVLADKTSVWVSVVVLATILAGAYGVSLTWAIAVLLAVWQVWAHARTAPWLRLGSVVVGSLLVGFLAKIPLQWLSGLVACLELFVLIWWVTGGRFQRPWRSRKPLSLSKHS